MSLTGKLILGFLFALVLQVAQIALGNTYTARLQGAAVLAADTLSATLAVQNGIEAITQLRDRLGRDGHGLQAIDTGVLRVYVDELTQQAAMIAGKAPADAHPHVESLQQSVRKLVHQFEQVQLAVRRPAEREAAADAVSFLDDAAQDLDEELHRTQVTLRTTADQAVQKEQAVRDLPLRASITIAGVGVVIMAAFVAWFSRQLVIPIQRAWSELEGRVAERTGELAQTVVQLECQIGERKRAEAQKDEMHRQLVDASRMAGMAELANGVLHNVGNVLNSVNVSADVLSQRLRDLRMEGIGRVAELFRGRAGDLREFLSTSQGQAVPGYLSQLASHLQREKGLLLDEVGELSSRIDHMKDIVDRQQSYARCKGVSTEVNATDIVREAIEMQRIPLQQAGVTVDIEVDGDDRCELDRARVLQILMNVIANARHAIRDAGRGEGRLTVRVERRHETLCIRVRDDGVGIPTSDLERVFAHGFTTKQDGHGFGLHHSANAATEMGGRLWAESDGRGLGAVFVLELPMRQLQAVTA